MSRSTKQHGFTLIEMLVVAPLIVIVVATIVGFMVSLVGNVTIANSRTQIQYDAQDALNQLEQDVFLSTAFIGSYAPASPQGEDNGTAAFTSASGDIILNQPATSANPADATREPIYYANRPNTCASGSYQVNNPFYVKVIYFVRNNTLYRRTIVPTWNTNAPPSENNSTVCKPVWQRGSCANGVSGAACTAKDAAILNNVASISLTTTYYQKSAPGTLITTDLSTADTVKVAITVTSKAAGETVTQTSELAASRASS